MNRSILIRLVALVVVTFLGFYYILFDAVGVKLTDRPFTVHVELPLAGGVYPDAYVTFRGVEIGKVSALHLHRDGVTADLALDHGARVPADVTASVKELTAAAEQYMDLVPSAPGPPYLHSGSTIAADHTTIPVSVGTLLDTVNSLVQSLHASDLNTLSKALAEGLGGAGGDLHSIIVDGSTLARALDGAIPGTEQLIDAGNNVLGTFNSTAGEFADFSANLQTLSQQVAQSNSDLIALLQNGSTAGAALTQFLGQTALPTVSLTDDLSSTTAIAYDREPAIRALFQVLPLFAHDVAMVTTGGQIRFEVAFNDDATVCPYTSTMVAPTSLVSTADLTADCTTTAPDLLQRGADKAPAPTQG